LNFDAAKVRICNPLRWVVRQQILGAKFIADIPERLVQLRKRTGIKIFSARMREKLMSGCLPPMSRRRWSQWAPRVFPGWISSAKLVALRRFRWPVPNADALMGAGI
jgi:hypothetical protein